MPVLVLVNAVVPEKTWGNVMLNPVDTSISMFGADALVFDNAPVAVQVVAAVNCMAVIWLFVPVPLKVPPCNTSTAPPVVFSAVL